MRMLVVGIALLVALLVVGCGDSQTTTTAGTEESTGAVTTTAQPVEDTTTTSAAKATTHKYGTAVTQHGITVTVSAPTKTPSEHPMDPPSAQNFVIDVTLANNVGGVLSISSGGDFYVQDDKGNRYGSDTGGSSPHPFDLVELPNFGIFRGTISFGIPEGSTIERVIYVPSDVSGPIVYEK